MNLPQRTPSSRCRPDGLPVQPGRPRPSNLTPRSNQLGRTTSQIRDNREKFNINLALSPPLHTTHSPRPQPHPLKAPPLGRGNLRALPRKLPRRPRRGRPKTPGNLGRHRSRRTSTSTAGMGRRSQPNACLTQGDARRSRKPAPATTPRSPRTTPISGPDRRHHPADRANPLRTPQQQAAPTPPGPRGEPSAPPPRTRPEASAPRHAR